MTIRVLVVDDSAVMRALITRKLTCEADIEVVATAANATEARTLIKKHDPDVVTLDIEMPGMDGLAFLEKIMTLRPTPVIIVSGSTRQGAKATAKALSLGAVDCYAKSTETRSIRDDDGGELVRLVREAAAIDFGTRRHVTARSEPAVPVAAARTQHLTKKPDLIVIGASTGGVEALHSLLAGFPEDCPPTLIVQHVNACFASAIVRSLNTTARPHVELAESDLILRDGSVLLAPGEDKHLEVGRAGSHGHRCVLREGDLVSGHRPSVDRLFASVARNFSGMALAILLTGMGEDGARGMLELSRNGAHTIAQDEDTSVVFGMPRAAIKLGAANQVLPLDQIAKSIFQPEGTLA